MADAALVNKPKCFLGCRRFPQKKRKRLFRNTTTLSPPTSTLCTAARLPLFIHLTLLQYSSAAVNTNTRCMRFPQKKSNINSNVNNLFIGCLQFPQKIRHLHLFLYSLLAAARPIQMLFKMPAFYTKKNRKRVILKYIYVNPPSMRPLCVSR